MLGELCASFLFNGTDACTAQGFALLRKACDLLTNQIEEICTPDLTADQAMAAPKESGTYDRDAVQELLHQYGIAFTGQTIPDSCLQDKVI